MASGSVMTKIFPFPDSENGKDDLTFEDVVGGRVKTIYGAESVLAPPAESQRLPRGGISDSGSAQMRRRRCPPSWEDPAQINSQLNLNPEQQRWRRTRPESFTN